MFGRILIFFSLTAIVLNARAVDFTSSDLPIVIIDTHGKAIPDEPKITADMKIIDNEGRNYLTDTDYDYTGKIGIEIRGSSSQNFPKKQYAVETRHEDGENRNVSLMGFPKENDWILHAPYSDKTLMRNVLVYTLARQLGWYASRCKFCELVKNDEYMGVYILMEKIKRDNDRVDISKLNPDEISGDDLTGGYVVKIDKFNGQYTEGWQSAYPARPGSNRRIFYQYHEPKENEIVDEQKQYIQNKIHSFETQMKSDYPLDYDNIINEDSFIDYFLVNELSKNVDGYRLSTFLYKDKDSDDPLIYAGPVWDYNLAFGNANYHRGDETDDWMLDIFYSDPDFQSDDFHPPFWWRKLWNDPGFRKKAVDRWQELRQTRFSTGHIFHMIDSLALHLEEARQRNYQRWPDVLGNYIWPNPSGYQNRTTYQSEINYMKSWINARLNWIDANIDPGNLSVDIPKADEYGGIYNYPNPFNPVTHIVFHPEHSGDVTIGIYNLRGELIEQITKKGVKPERTSVLFDGTHLKSGIYLYKVNSNGIVKTGKAVLIK